jgi:hypothetical protein
MARHDTTFVREGRPLHEWLPEVVSPDAKVRARAGDAIAAMFYALPSVHTDYDDLEDEAPDSDADADAWRRAVREAVERPDFPRRPFFVAAAANIVGAHAKWMANWKKSDAELDRVLDKIEARVGPGATPAERATAVRRRGRAISASLRRDNARTPNEALSMANMVVGWVIEAAGPALLEAPEVLWMLLDSQSHAFLATKALERIGPPAAPLFLDWLMSKLEEAEGWFNEQAALVSVCREDPRALTRIMEILESAADAPGEAPAHPDASPGFHTYFYRADKVWPAAGVLAGLGPSARTAPEVGERVIPTLLRLTHSPHPGHRAAAAHAIGHVGKGLDDGSLRPLVDRMLELTEDHPWVAGRAIDALGHLAAEPERVVPRLVELFDNFEEFNPDEAYSGRHARVCRALEGIGPAAAPAVGRLVAELRREVPREEAEGSVDLLLALGAIGPAAAAEALPLLKQLQVERDDDARLAAAIRRISGASP